jgi:rhamnulokinase
VKINEENKTILREVEILILDGQDRVMGKTVNLLGFDLGAESGRAILGKFDGNRLVLEEMHRFYNNPVRIKGSLYWDILRLFYEMKQGLLKTVLEYGDDISSIGVDTWGVDYGLLDKNGNLLGNPYHYRDSRTDGVFEKAFAIVPRREIFMQTGIQFLQFNSIFQLLMEAKTNLERLKLADTLLFIPDLLNYFFTGEKRTEFTIASTSQAYNPITKTWAAELLEAFGIPPGIFGDIVQPGTICGNLLDDIAFETGAGKIPVVTVAGHDTGSAVVAVPATGKEHVFLSSGTWSIMGVELEEPLIDEASLKNNFTNEGGVDYTFRFEKNIMGLWLVQECRRRWERAGESFSYDELSAMARDTESLKTFVDPDHNDFLNPQDMPSVIQNFCARTNQYVPETKGEIVRCALESLALKYRWVIERLEEMLGRRFDVLHIIGGGAQNVVLSQFTANAINKPVITGPIEATAIGNLLVQAMALGEVGSVVEIREVIRNSFPTKVYEPENTDKWDEAYERFVKLLPGN